jgi:hypothetical protein
MDFVPKDVLIPVLETAVNQPGKITFVLFTNSNVDTSNLNIYIDNKYSEMYTANLKDPLQCTNNSSFAKFKFLSVLFDPNRNFHFHIKYISAKLSNGLFHFYELVK